MTDSGDLLDLVNLTSPGSLEDAAATQLGLADQWRLRRRNEALALPLPLSSFGQRRRGDHVREPEAGRAQGQEQAHRPAARQGRHLEGAVALSVDTDVIQAEWVRIVARMRAIATRARALAARMSRGAPARPPR